MKTWKTSEKPGKGTYKCIVDSYTVNLDQDSDCLPPCEECIKAGRIFIDDTKWVKVYEKRKLEETKQNNNPLWRIADSNKNIVQAIKENTNAIGYLINIFSDNKKFLYGQLLITSPENKFLNF